jgi:glyoxylase-like metal-dependent hydrolase (beta-lactamase superfamily II)
MTLEGTNTYLVGRAGCWVIDPGPADEGHIEKVRSAAGERGGIAGVLLTHSHGDHAAGVELLGEPVTRLADGESAGPLTALATPGHAADHVCLLDGKTCFSGDLILGEGSTFVPPADSGGSLSDYMRSLERLRELDLELICPGHGPYVRDPKGKIDEYIEHRLEREQKLVAAIESGERSRAKLLELAWDDVPAELRGAAAVVMQAHLEKLEAEGRLPAGLRD